MNAVVDAQAKEKEGNHLHLAGDILDPHELTQLECIKDWEKKQNMSDVDGSPFRYGLSDGHSYSK